MGTSSGEFWKYSKFETYQEFMGINWEIYKTVSYTNININILFDHRLTCIQMNTHFKNDSFGFFGGDL